MPFYFRPFNIEMRQIFYARWIISRWDRVQLSAKEDRQTATPTADPQMSLLLHILGQVFFFTVLGVIVLTGLRWFTKTSGPATSRSLGEWPEDKASYVDRISAHRLYSSSRRDLQDEQERKRA